MDAEIQRLRRAADQNDPASIEALVAAEKRAGIHPTSWSLRSVSGFPKVGDVVCWGYIGPKPMRVEVIEVLPGVVWVEHSGHPKPYSRKRWLIESAGRPVIHRAHAGWVPNIFAYLQKAP